MAECEDVEFTYSLTDRIFGVSVGELADFSGAKYDGDFSLSLEQAQRRNEYVAEQIGIGRKRRVLDPGCGWGALLNFGRMRGGTISAGRASSAQVAPGCLRALLLAPGLPRGSPGGDLTCDFHACRELLARGGRLYLQTMALGAGMIAAEQAVRPWRGSRQSTPTPGTWR